VLTAAQFLKLGDITIFKDGPFTFRIRIRLGNFKVGGRAIIVRSSLTSLQGHNEEIGKEQYFWLTAVIRQHNVLFDVCVWLVCHLFLRGAFEQKVRMCRLPAFVVRLRSNEQTLNEIYALKDGELKIKKSKLKEALYGHRHSAGNTRSPPRIAAFSRVVLAAGCS
jgi:hypothetical protein